jgi:hypothetical protein
MLPSFAKCFLFVALFISSSAFAASNTLVIITKPYDNGSVDLKADASNDTVTFSNGVKLLNYYPINGIPETHLSTGAIVLFDTLHTKAGYKYSSLIEPDSFTNGLVQFGKVVYFLGGNPDTFWNSAIKFPDSLHRMDSMMFYSQAFPAGKYLYCKRIYVTDLQIMPYGGRLIELANYNALFYVTCQNGQNMKIQVYGTEYDTTIHTLGGGFTYSNISLKGYKLRWAVDSLGNGKFDISTRTTVSRLNNSRTYDKSDIASLHFWSKNSRIRNGYLINGRIVRAIDARVVPYITKGDR